MDCLASFEVIQILRFGKIQLISRKFAACSLQSFSKVTSKYDHASKVHPSMDIFVFRYALFVFLDNRKALTDVKCDHGRVCDILYPIEKKINHIYWLIYFLYCYGLPKLICLLIPPLSKAISTFL